MASPIFSSESMPITKSTYAEVAERSTQLRTVLANRGIRFHRDSALGKLLRDAEGLAKDWNEGKRDNGIRRLINCAHANRIAEAILEVQSDRDAQQCLMRIAGNNINLSDRSPSMGKDHLWELDLLYFFRRQGLAAKLIDPPDIILELDGHNYPVACKKVYSEKGVQAQMKKGVKQLVSHKHGGIVAFNLDDLVPEDNLLRSRTHQDASNYLADFNQNFIDRHRFSLQRYVADGRCDGVLVSTSVLADVEASAPRFNMITEEHCGHSAMRIQIPKRVSATCETPFKATSTNTSAVITKTNMRVAGCSL